MRKFYHHRNILLRHLLIILSLIILVPVIGWLGASFPQATSSTDGLFLKMPPFLNQVQAKTNNQVDFTATEAGIAAYFKADSTITLANVRDIYRSVEDETEDYIIGSIGVPDYGESHDVHVYIHKDGWVMAYYHKSEPASHLFDWAHYNGSSALSTKFQLVLETVATQIAAPSPNPTYYHFAFPNADRLMLIAEAQVGSGSDTFEVTLPRGLIYYERSWSLSSWLPSFGDGTTYLLNDTEIKRHTRSGISKGVYGVADLPEDSMHTLKLINNVFLIDDGRVKAYTGLALVYKERN